ncbi:MAG TPA: Maf family nucleotide pyrophosphatase [Burkholderiales bacterium]|nr:Maf family nucleotide pyrophosphatase [Burkholderiales bacterium]
MTQPRRLVLASSSRYRKVLLERLGLAFETGVPGVDEAPLPGETPGDTALRLAARKAQALAGRYRDALIIGSDQVAVCEGERLDKPGNYENAVRQLRTLSARAADFLTAVSVLDAASGALESRLVPCRVHFRALDEAQIDSYLRREQPYDCAASARAEGLGIALIARIETDDPSALIGLPLIALTELLGRAGLRVL